MGNSASTQQQSIPENQFALTEALNLFTRTYAYSKSSYSPEIQTALRTLLHNFEKHGLITTDQSTNRMHVNSYLLDIWFHKDFSSILSNLFSQWLQRQEDITTKNPVFVKRDEWKFLDLLVRLILFLTEPRLVYTLNNIAIFKNLTEGTQKHLKNYSSAIFDMDQNTENSSNNPLFDLLTDKTEGERIYKCLFLITCDFIKLKTNAITRSSRTIRHVDAYADSCFYLFCRLYFLDPFYQDLQRRAIKVNNEANLENASYFIGRAVENNNPALLDAALSFAYSILHTNKTNRKINSLPMHLFPSLPNPPDTDIYDFYMTVLLYILTYKPDPNDPKSKNMLPSIPRSSFNWVLCYQILNLLLDFGLANVNKLHSYYLQNICGYTSPSSLQRIYLIPLIKECLKKKDSTVFKRFVSYEAINYQVTFANRKTILTSDQAKNYLETTPEILKSDIVGLQTKVVAGLLNSSLSKNQPIGDTTNKQKEAWDRIIKSRKNQFKATNANF